MEGRKIRKGDEKKKKNLPFAKDHWFCNSWLDDSNRRTNLQSSFYYINTYNDRLPLMENANNLEDTREHRQLSSFSLLRFCKFLLYKQHILV